MDTFEHSNKTEVQEIRDIRNLLWGPHIRVDVFRRWSQGFEFSEVEPSALLQRQGGPCAVIAPVQAFLLKILLTENPGHNFKELTPAKCKMLLIQASCNILIKCKDKLYKIVQLTEPEQGVEAKEDMVNNKREEKLNTDMEAIAMGGFETSVKMQVADVEEKVKINSFHRQEFEWSPEEFHERLSVITFETINDVEKYYSDNIHVLSEQYGVLLLMYTVLLTKGFDNIIGELLDTSEPLIHDTYGYAAQGLINLMLTGRAVPHVWDHDKEVGGLKLKGLDQQSDIGFITLMEQMRYCTVGSFYKNPKNPVWVMGSETHLTGINSILSVNGDEKRLVSPETPSETARRVFKSYDPDGNNFIPTPVLQNVLSALNLVSEPEYCDIMQKKLDPENLGIILLNAFMDEFFSEEKKSVPDTFDLLHYNGIPGSNHGNQIKYNRGSAILLECDLKAMDNLSNPMLTCLQTKWPNIEVNWHDSRTPSLN